MLRSPSGTFYRRMIAVHQTWVFRGLGQTQMTTTQCLEWSALASPCHLRLEERGDFCTHIGTLIMWCNCGSGWQGRAILSTWTQRRWSLYTLCLRQSPPASIEFGLVSPRCQHNLSLSFYIPLKEWRLQALNELFGIWRACDTIKMLCLFMMIFLDWP